MGSQQRIAAASKRVCRILAELVRSAASGSTSCRLMLASHAYVGMTALASAALRCFQVVEIWQLVRPATGDIRGAAAASKGVYRILAEQVYRASSAPASQARGAFGLDSSTPLSRASDSGRRGLVVIDQCSLCLRLTWVDWWEDMGGDELCVCHAGCID